MMTEPAVHLLIVDGSADDRAYIRRMLEVVPEHRFTFSEAETGKDAIRFTASQDRNPVSCILMAEHPGDMDAADFLSAVSNHSAPTPCAVVVLTDADSEMVPAMLQAGAQDCLIRESLSTETLNRAVENAIVRHSVFSEQRTAKHEQREGDAAFRALLEVAPDAMVIVDQHGIIVLVNSLTKVMFGYTESELIGKHVEMLMPQQLCESHVDYHLAYSTGREDRSDGSNLELTGLRKDRSLFPIELSLNPIETTQGVLISSAIRDVTHRKQVENRLRRSDAQLRFIMHSMPQKIGTATPSGEVDYYNPQMSEFTGLSFDELQAWGWAKFIHPDDVDEHIRIWKNSVQSGETFEFESRFRRFDGEYRWHFTRALPMRDPSGKIVMWVGSNTDIDDIKKAEAALQISEVRYRRLFEAAKDGILILDFSTGRIVDSNPFMSDLLGYTHENFLKKELWEIGLFQDKNANEAAVRSLQETGYLRYEHLPLESKTGLAVEVEIVANAYSEADHQVIQCNVRDITERSRLEKLLQAQAKELENLHLRKDEFLAMLSHELRSPLAPIANAVQLMSLQQDTESRTQQQARNIIERQLGKLQHLVDDLLEVSRITSGRVQLRREWVAINGIAQGAVETVRPLIQQRRHELQVQLPTSPMQLYADAARLEQVVINLLTNAAKYTEEGGRITLSVAREQNECVIRVRDTGVGISPALLPNVFDLFTQAERSLDRSQGGLGIGLALVQRLTELHGGTVEAHSRLGEGSEFVVRLPLKADGSPAVEAAVVSARNSNRPLRILVVDDNVDTVLGFSLLLKAQGHEVRTAYNGLDVVRTAAEFHPHVIMLDIGLPGLNGYEVAKLLRGQPLGSDMTLIALTGYGQDSDRRTSIAAGFNYHLVKPARFEQLLQILSTVEGD